MFGRIRVEGRVVDDQFLAVVHHQPVAHRRGREDQGEVVLALQALLDHLKVQQTQEPAAEPESKGGTAIFFVDQRCIVEFEFFDGHRQIFVSVRGNRVDGGKYHRLGLLETGQRLITWLAVVGDRVAAAGIAHRFDAGDHVSHLPGAKLFLGNPDNLKDSHLFDLVGGVVGHEADAVPGADGSCLDAEMDNGASERIVVGVEDQGLQRRIDIAYGRRQLLDHGFHDVVDAQTLFGRGEDDRFRVQPQILFNLILDPVDVRRRQVDLVDHRNDFQVVFQGQVKVGQGLGLHPLAGVDQEERSLAGSQRPRDLVGEVDVPRRID